jgi:hypothetical protein
MLAMTSKLQNCLFTGVIPFFMRGRRPDGYMLYFNRRIEMSGCTEKWRHPQKLHLSRRFSILTDSSIPFRAVETESKLRL